jgi:hypothetical protein
VTVALAVEARSRGRKVEVERIEAEAAGGRAWGSGRYDAVSDEVALTLTAQNLDWQRLPLLLPEWAEALTGTLSGEVQLAGTTSTPTGRLRVSLDEPRVRDHKLPPLSLEARFDGRELRVAGKADAVFLRGHAALADRSYFTGQLYRSVPWSGRRGTGSAASPARIPCCCSRTASTPVGRRPCAASGRTIWAG